MKLFSGKRRGFSKSASEIQAFVGAAGWCPISNDGAAWSGFSECCTSLALHATNRWERTAAADEVWALCSSSACWAASPTGIGAVSYSEHLTDAGRISVASRSVAPPTRLETRTKESNMYASRWVY